MIRGVREIVIALRIVSKMVEVDTKGGRGLGPSSDQLLHLVTELK